MPHPILRILLTAAAAGPAAAETLHAVTLNAWHGLRPEAALRLDGEPAVRREVRLAGQLQALADIAPDLLFLQELNPAPGLARRYAVALGHDEVHKVDSCGIRIGGCGVPTNVRSGLAILARPGLGLRRLGASRLSGSGLCSDVAGFQLAESRYALFAEITLGESPVLLVNVHLHNAPRSTRSDPRLAELVSEGTLTVEEAARVAERIERRVKRQEREVEALLAAIDRRAARARYAGIVLAGDLNAEPGAEAFDALVRHGFRPAFETGSPPAPTYDPSANADNAALAAPKRSPYPTFGLSALADLYAAERARPRRIDHVLVRGCLEASETARVLDRPEDGLFPSDHFGIRTRISIAQD